MRHTKKAVNEVGIGIIAMAVLLLLGSIFVDDSGSFGNGNNNYNNNNNNNNNYYPHENFLFYLNNTNIGKQNKVTESFPNIELGSEVENDIIYIGNNFRLNANPFSSNRYNMTINIDDPKDTKYLLIYFKPERLSGDNEMIISVNGKRAVATPARASDVPINIPIYNYNRSTLTLSYELVKPSFLDIFNWNKLDITDIKVVEVKQNTENNQREFNFQIDKEFLERAYVDLSITCEKQQRVSEAIKIEVNGYIISNQNPDCTSRHNKITAQIPLNILKEDKNTLILETEGFYKVAYGINKVYYNDKELYKFTINSFNDIIDVVIYGDFDREVIDLRLNSQTFSLRRDEIKSIIPYLRFGVNELKILNKPVEIDELIIEKNEFLY